MTKLEIIAAYLNILPSYKMALVGKADQELFALLDTALQPKNGELHLFIYEDIVAELPSMRINYIPEYDKIFRTVAREYELLILNHITHAITDPVRLFKTAFRALENSGDILVIEDDLSGLKELLESAGFVAVNEIENSDGVYLLSAKKMHGWGHGL